MKQKLLLDTCVVIDMLLDFDGMDSFVRDFIEDPENDLCASFETMREIIVLFNNKKLLSRRWETSQDVLRYIVDELEIDFLPLRPEVGHTYSRLKINEVQNHRDPSDHVIIAHAITQNLTLLSSDTRFPFYRRQGLDLIEY